MNDLEVCKRIAGIEGVELERLRGDFLINKNAPFGSLVNAMQSFASCKTTESFKAAQYRYKEYLYDPLTDDALCFKLMVKYKVNMSWLWEENDGTPHYQAYISEDSSDVAYNKSPNRAICLAIIEAHNG
ncbi:MAG: hypothetical protein GY928_16610 [Colwellia sp.]|nr:hypothetical protein [Colwellia sp.]